ESVGNDEHAAIDDRSCGGGGDGFHVADAAADAAEKFSASNGQGGSGEGCVAGWSHGAADELSEVVDVGEAEIVGLILRVLGGLEDGGDVVGAEAVRDSHFVEIGVADEGEEAAVLVLPAEASDASLSGGFEDRSLHDFAMDSAFAQFRLSLGDCDEGSVVDGFDESIAESVEGGA